MYDFENLVGELLQSRPDLTRPELMRRIEDKKNTIGAGYLTNQGALFLVAGELGVSLRKEEVSSELSVKDLYIGANDVTVVARVLGVYPEAVYNKKDGGSGKYRRLVLFDGAQSVRLTAWEEKAEEIGKADLAIESAVRVVSAYVKQGLDGRPNLNLGKRGRIEIVSDQRTLERLPLLATVTDKLTRVSQDRQFVAIEGVISTDARYSEFMRSDGSPGSLYQFGMSNGEGTDLRVVIWSPSSRPELRKGQKVVITNVRGKRSANGELEVHGDAGSTVVTGPMANRVELRAVAVNRTSSLRTLLGLDRNGKMVPVELGPSMKEPALGNVITVVPDSESDGKLYCNNPGSVQESDGQSFPGSEELVTKLRDAKVEDSKIMVEVIALSHGNVDDVKLKDGSTVKKGELVVGDDTGEIKLVAWRGFSGAVSGIQPGERLRVVGATVKSTKVGVWILQHSGVTVIERMKSRN